MIMVVNVPMQPIDSSYSKQWYEWFEAELNARNIAHITILPQQLVQDIGKGYIDTVSVIHFRAAQLQLITGFIQAGRIPKNERVVFFFHNAWFPIDQLAFLRDMLGAHDWKFVGCFRDGTYDKWDMSARNNMYVWGRDIENGWLKIYDKIIVGSEYHYDVIVEERVVRESKIAIIPWHVEVPDIEIEKENIIVFPHRLDPEKQPELFEELAKEFWSSGWLFIRTRDLNLSKKEYYELLAKSKVAVSTALLEMFGNAMVEAALLGCIPLVPDRLAYREIFTSQYRYKDYKELKFMLELAMTPGVKYPVTLQKNYYSRLQNKQFFDDVFNILEGV
jgi:glycosyltransferase involved in cell wall biosynthesis